MLLHIYLLEPDQTPLFNNTITWSLVILILLMLTGVIVYVRKLKAKLLNENKKLLQKLSDRSYNVMMQKWDLERKNISISQQNQEILESLRYARSIQTAIIPKEDQFNSWFNDGFVYYKPKDIVSGDFYFLERAGDLIFLAVADCTGHGVAGAFMSMMGNALLKQIILQNKITDPSLILYQLNEGVVDALHQKESTSHAGMDIALCIINMQDKKIEFAGANRPLIIIRNNEEQIIKPDKLPIGGFFPDENRHFSNQLIDINEGDCIYLFTDGYADQFGGMEGKKIMIKKFKEILLNVHMKPMMNQRNELEAYFENWRGRLEQVDDVLVVGIKF